MLDFLEVEVAKAMVDRKMTAEERIVRVFVSLCVWEMNENVRGAGVWMHVIKLGYSKTTKETRLQGLYIKFQHKMNGKIPIKDFFSFFFVHCDRKAY